MDFFVLISLPFQIYPITFVGKTQPPTWPPSVRRRSLVPTARCRPSARTRMHPRRSFTPSLRSCTPGGDTRTRSARWTPCRSFRWPLVSLGLLLADSIPSVFRASQVLSSQQHYALILNLLDLSSIYISGWQCSSTASSTNEPGPDFADYPMDTVPKKCEFLYAF